MPIAIIYTRFSPRPDAETCDSAEKQEERCRAYATGKGYCISQYPFTDKDTSGGVLVRPGLSDAIGAMLPYDDPILVVDSPDRLARDVLVFLTIKRQVADVGGRIEYADGSPRGETPEGELLLGILAQFAQYERARIRHRTRRGLKRKREQGVYLGKPPVGFMRDPDDKKKLIDCKAEQEAVIHAKILRKECGYSSGDITMELNRVFGSFRGKPWSDRTVRKLLKKIHSFEDRREWSAETPEPPIDAN